MAVTDALRAVRTRVDRAALAAGRDPSEVALLPVSKFHPVEDIAACMAAGVTLFGENRPQELAAKAEALPSACFAMIGNLQRNKAQMIVDHAAELHSLDSLALAESLSRRLVEAQRALPVLIQVNTSGEPQKSGVSPDDALAFAAAVAGLPGLELRGLMTMAMASPDREQVAGCFRRLVDVQARLRAELPEQCWDTLSMGMSGDFEIAIAEGSTMVRVGTAIFGPREAV